VERPVPAILEYIPYRRDRGGGDSDGTWHSTVPAMASSRLRVARLYSLVRGLLGMDLTLGGERSEGER
jgi:hypothetical protein